MSDHPRPAIYILLGCAVVVTGAAFAVTLPPALTGVALLMVLLRVCWLDDNIKSDLLGATEMPPDYLRAAARAPRLPGAEPLPDDPALMATAMRGQSQAWTAAGLGAASALVLAHSGWSTAPALLAATALIALAFRQADRLVTTMVHLDHGRPLPPHDLARARRWAHSWRMGKDD